MPDHPKSLPSFMSAQVDDARRFYVPAAMQSTGLRVVSGGWERCAGDYEIRRDGFMHPTVELVAGGRGTLNMGGRTVDLRRGVAFSYGPEETHELTTDPTDRLSKFFVNLSGATAETFLQEAGMRPGCIVSLEMDDELEATFDRLISAGQRGTASSARIAALELRILMLLISEARLSNDPRTSRARQRFLQCRSYVEEHFLSLRSVEEAAEACGVTQTYFSRLFTRFSGQPAYQFLLHLKMSHAALLLEHRGFNVTQTAEFLMMDPFHFSRAFKRVHGRAPSSFKSNL